MKNHKRKLYYCCYSESCDIIACQHLGFHTETDRCESEQCEKMFTFCVSVLTDFIDNDNDHQRFINSNGYSLTSLTSNPKGD